MTRLLYLQRPEILEVHRPVVDSFMKENLPEVAVRFSDGTAHNEDPDADWVIAPAASWVEPVLRRAVRASWVHFQGAGTDQLDAYISSRPDLRFTTSPGVSADAIAEYVVGALLYFAKDFDLLLAAQAEGVWRRRWLKELTGSTIVIFGVGQIGVATARRLRPFGVRLIGVSRSGRPSAAFDETCPVAQLDAVIPQADCLVVAAPLTAETADTLGAERLRKLPAHCVLINVARGGIVDEAALVEQLREGHLRGAAFDVFEHEPLPPADPLWTAPRALLTPHVAGTTQFYLERMLRIFARSIPSPDNPPPIEAASAIAKFRQR